MKLLDLFDDIFIEILSYLSNVGVLNLSLTSRSVRQRLLNCPNVPNNFLCLLSALNFHIDKSAQFLSKSNVCYLKAQIPRISSFVLRRCHCLIICRSVGDHDSKLFNYYRISHPNCSNEHTKHFEQDTLFSDLNNNRLISDVSVTNNSIIFYAFHPIYQNIDDPVQTFLIYYEFMNGQFFCHRNQLNYHDILQRVKVHKKQFRFVSENSLRSCSFDCEPLNVYPHPNKHLVKNGIKYYGLNEGASYPLYFVTWGPFVDRLNVLFLGDLKNRKLYSFKLTINLKFASPIHITTNNQIIFVPHAISHLNKYELFKYDLVEKTMFKIEIDFWKKLG